MTTSLFESACDTVKIQLHQIVRAMCIAIPVSCYFFIFLSASLFGMEEPKSTPFTKNDASLVESIQHAQAFLVSITMFLAVYVMYVMTFGYEKLRPALKRIVLPCLTISLLYWTVLTILGLEFFGTAFINYILCFFENYLLAKEARKPVLDELRDENLQEMASDGTPWTISRSSVILVVLIGAIQMVLVGIYYSSSFIFKLIIRAVVYPGVFTFIIFLFHHHIRSYSLIMLPRRRTLAVWVYSFASIMGRILTVNAGNTTQMMQTVILVNIFKFVSRVTFKFQHYLLKHARRAWKTKLNSLPWSNKNNQPTLQVKRIQTQRNVLGSELQDKVHNHHSNTESNQDTHSNIQTNMQLQEMNQKASRNLSLYEQTQHPNQVVADEENPPVKASETGSQEFVDFSIDHEDRRDKKHSVIKVEDKGYSEERLLVLRQIQIYDEIQAEYCSTLVSPMFLFLIQNMKYAVYFDVVESVEVLLFAIGAQLAVEVVFDFLSTLIECHFLNLNYKKPKEYHNFTHYLRDILFHLFSIHLIISLYSRFDVETVE